MSRLNNNRSLLLYDMLASGSGVTAFSTTRIGGCSKGRYASFNCSPYCGDEPLAVRENMFRLCDMLPSIPIGWVIPHQVHGTKILAVDERFLSLSQQERTERLEGIDALITDKPGYCLCVSTADCIPVLLYDEKRKVVAVVHAGWRGTVAYIVEKTIRRMCDQYGSSPENIIAAIGPGISLEAFEVGVEVYEAFLEAGFPMEKVARWYRPSSRWHIDLWEANKWQLQRCGIVCEHIELSGVCTYLQCDDFFSARRLGIQSGRILSGIMLDI